MKSFTKSISFTLLALIIIISIPVSAQDKKGGDRKKNREEQMEKMKSMKIAFISDNLDLSPAEAEKFWPIFNEYEKSRDAITAEIMKPYEKQDEAPEELSDDEADKVIKMRFTHEQALLDLKTEYYEKYLQVLPASKIIKLYEIELNFRRHLMSRLGRGEGQRHTEGNNRKEGGPRAEPRR